MSDLAAAFTALLSLGAALASAPGSAGAPGRVLVLAGRAPHVAWIADGLALRLEREGVPAVVAAEPATPSPQAEDALARRVHAGTVVRLRLIPLEDWERVEMGGARVLATAGAEATPATQEAATPAAGPAPGLLARPSYERMMRQRRHAAARAALGMTARPEVRDVVRARACLSVRPVGSAWMASPALCSQRTIETHADSTAVSVARRGSGEPEWSALAVALSRDLASALVARLR